VVKRRDSWAGVAIYRAAKKAISYKTPLVGLLVIFLILTPALIWSQGKKIIVDHACTRITQIPEAAILAAKQKLHIAYGHTSHGSQLITGMNGLVPFMNGKGYPNNLYAWNNGGTGGALDLHDYAMGGDVGYYPDWMNNTRDYLGEANSEGRGSNNPDINVIIWSWCGQVSSLSEQEMITNYLTPMSNLEEEYFGIKFVYMTGHLDGSGSTGNLTVRNNQIRNFCHTNNKILYDFADIESYDPDGAANYMLLSADENCDYDSDGNGSRDKNWALDWQNSHTENDDWYDCSPDHTQALNGNLKAYAAWWLWARLGGWNGESWVDFIGTWDGQGVYYRNSDTGAWVKMASPATLITAGDLGGDGVDDLIGIWPTQGGVWVKSSTNGAWTKLSTTAEHIAAGDMNGDGRVDFLGTWDGQGVFYRDSVSSAWVKMASPADLITAGDLDGDGKDDLIGIWPAQGGVWVKYSATDGWAKLSSTAKDIAAGDMNGDGRDDLLATWDGQGVYYRNSVNGAWVKMATPADQVTCGYLDGDAKADLIGIWPTQGGVWVKYSATGTWAKLSSSARDIAAGKMRTGTGGSMPVQALFGPMGGYAQGPESLIQYKDTSSEGPGGLHFVYQTEEQLIPQEHESGMMRVPGLGEPGFRCVEEKNLIPEESRESDVTKEDRERNTK